MASQLLPLELIDKCVGSRIWVIMKGEKGEQAQGFRWTGAESTDGKNDRVRRHFTRVRRLHMVLEDVIEFDYSGAQTKLAKILLNGNNICMLIPGGEGPVPAAH